MRLLLDTHTLLWFFEDSPQLSLTARQVIEEADNTPLLSVASLWEMAIKTRIGKLAVMTPPFAQTIVRDLAASAIDLLPISPAHALRVATLPRGHNDPFDLLLIAQSLVEDIPIVGRDAQFDAFGVTRIW